MSSICEKQFDLFLFCLFCLIKRRSTDLFKSNVFYLVFNDLKHVFKVFYMKSSSSLFQATHRLWTGIIGDFVFYVKRFFKEFKKFFRFAGFVLFLYRFYLFFLQSFGRVYKTILI